MQVAVAIELPGAISDPEKLKRLLSFINDARPPPDNLYAIKRGMLQPTKTPYLLPFDGALPRSPPDGLPEVDGQFPPGPG
ncbi:hypothetical protein [Billgrantia lactosivorans]|uniref:hypothetical protein n=1 Tax=Billgrantia lactosivorans TaxID=2185141 RepID=UPI0013A6B362|nr:hypothetical protein [Halomonas lactosivorans]